MAWADGTPKWTRHPPVPFTCPVCSTTIMMPPSIATGRRYCSASCRSVSEYQDAVDRFWSKVNKTADCWLWLSACDDDGYGRFCIRSRTVRAHRLSWELAFGDPGQLSVLHRCDTPPCVRPDHLFLGDAEANAKDRVAKGRSQDQRGEASPGARLTETQARAIKASNGNAEIVASQFGVSKRTVFDIRSGRSWGHL